MSKARTYLESKGWRLWSRRKHGMYIKERWYHPRNGAETFNQGDAVTEQRRIDRAANEAAKSQRTEASQ